MPSFRNEPPDLIHDMHDEWANRSAEVLHGRLWGPGAVDPDRRVLTVIGDRTFTAAELWASVDERACELVEAGLRRGDRLCLLQDNCSDLILDLLAAFRLGVVAAPMNTALRGESLASVVAELAPCVLRPGPEHIGAARSAVANVEGVALWPVGEGNVRPVRARP